MYATGKVNGVWLSILPKKTAVKNYHKLSGIKNAGLLFYSFRCQKSEMSLVELKSSCWQSYVLFWRF